jgi:integrase/recombinase XerC
MNDKSHSTVEQWLASLDRQGRSELTVKSYRRGLVNFIRWSEQTYGEQFDPSGIIPRDVADWVARQKTVEKAAPATINARLVALSRYFKWAIKQGLSRTNPTEDIPRARQSARQPKALKKTHVRRLLRRVHKSGSLRDAALVEFILGTGLRVSETLNVQVSDIFIGERKGEVVVRNGKGGVQRRVPLTAQVRNTLQDYLEQYPDLEDDDLLWIGERGPLRDRSAVFYLLKKYARQAELDPDLVSPHVLRHTFATRYLAANPDDLRGLAAILGHANLNTIMIYTEPTTEDLAARMERAEVVRKVS